MKDKKKLKIIQVMGDQLHLLHLFHIQESQRLLYQVINHLDRLHSNRRSLDHCLMRGWSAATGKLFEQVERTLRDLPYSVETTLHMIRQSQEQIPRWGSLLAELDQLEQEFDQVEYNTQELFLSVVTEAIELEGYYLGEFEIQLEISKLGQMKDTNVFRIIAQDPHPAATNDAVTHPHVSEEYLCAGDALVPMVQALAAGRICDAFMLVRSVLETYNSSSPYVSLDDWEGVSCYDCGYTVSGEDIYYCEHCDREFCSECFGYCSQCETSLCKGCLTTCPVCEEDRCENCMASCEACGESMCVSCLEDNLCPTCEEESEDPQDESEEAIESEQQTTPA